MHCNGVDVYLDQFPALSSIQIEKKVTYTEKVVYDL